MIEMKMILAIVGIAIAVGIDWRMRKIPNVLTFTMIILGLALNTFQNGFTGFQHSFLGLCLGILLLYFPFQLGGVGGGDVKLMGAIGSLLGPVFIFKIFLASALCGGILSFIYMIKRKAVRKTLEAIKAKAFYFLMTKTVLPESREASGKKQLSIPYSFAIGFGTLFVLLWIQGG